jgi:serine/threonine protein kinase
LITVHDLGFVYGDLKPENIVITERDHIKLTDFGACRPYTPEAAQLLRESRNAIASLRNGDWREQPADERLTVQVSDDTDGVNTAGVDTSAGATEDLAEQDNRVEGTPAYLPPEVLNGAKPDVLTDAWSLGCTMHFCLFGRPPLFGEQEQVVQQLVRFTSASPDSNPMFGPRDNTSDEAKELIQSLLTVDPSQRMSVKVAVSASFFTAHNVNVTELHFGPAVPLAKGGIEPQPDAEWARRQFSKIWSPMPQEFNFYATASALDAIAETSFERDAGFFPTSGVASLQHRSQQQQQQQLPAVMER